MFIDKESSPILNTVTFKHVLSAVLGSHNVMHPELLQGVQLVLSALSELIHCKTQENTVF